MASVEMIANADDPAIAAWIAARLRESLVSHADGIAICLPGGTTPFPIIERLAGLPLDWRRISAWPGDDRIVPENHPASNTGRLRALLEPAGARVMALAEAAHPPRFALTWLGMGTDGHVASLFPAIDPRADDPRQVVRVMPDPLPPEAPYARLSLTIPALVNCERLVFVIRGADKRALFEAAARGANDLPVARLLAASHQPVTCFT